MTEFPCLLFKKDGPHFGPPGFTYDSCAARDAVHLAELLAAGWFYTLAEAIDGKQSEPAQSEDAPVTRAELEQKARELGLQFHHRTGDKKLAEMIEAALK